jgi:serine protease Do
VKLIDGREFQGVVTRDYRSDLALVKIEASNLTAAKLGDSDKVKIGHWAIAIGSPYRYEGSFSVGVISSLARRQSISDRSGAGRFYPNMIQTDAAINPGNSGGPLVYIEGDVVGINTAIESESGGSVGIGFAIPINSAKFVIEQLRSHGKVRYGYLGISPNTITPRLATLYRVGQGALVTDEPAPDSPAAKAGIEVEDVITSINDKPVRNELDLRTIISRIAPGTTVRIKYVREGEEKTVRVVLSEMPDSEPARPPAEAGPMGLGIEVAAISPEAAKRVGLAETAEGVVISAIKDASVVEDSLLRGDVILQVNSVRTPTIEAFEKAVSGLRAGDTVRVRHAGRRFGQTIKRVAIIQLD